MLQMRNACGPDTWVAMRPGMLITAAELRDLAQATEDKKKEREDNPSPLYEVKGAVLDHMHWRSKTKM